MKIQDKGLPQVVFVATVVLAFLFLTAGIPLIQLGLLPHLGDSKKQYMRIANIAVVLLSLILVLLRWKCPALLERTWLFRLWHKLLQQPLWKSVFMLWAGYTAALISVGFFRHAALETRAFDLGIFAQAVWNTTQGHFLFSSLKDGICLLGDHFSPLLILLTPFYKLWPDPRVLLILQPAISALCLFPLAKIVHSRFQNAAAVLVFCLIYIFYMPTRAALHEDFHPEALAEPLMFLAFLWLEEKRFLRSGLTLVIILMAKESMAGIVAAFGFYEFFFGNQKRRSRIFGIFWMAAGPLYLLACTKLFIPLLSGQPYFYKGFYDDLARGGLGVLLPMFLDFERWEYVLKIFSPLLFLSWIDPPSLVLTLPVLLQNLLSDNGVARSLNYHYTLGLGPFVFISAVLGLKRLYDKSAFVRSYFSWVLALLLFMGLIRSGAPEYFYGWQSAHRITARTQMIQKEMSKIPERAIVLTHNNLVPQAVNRREIYQFDYNAIPTKTDSALKTAADYVVMDVKNWEPGTIGIEDEIKALTAEGYGLQFENDGFYILQKSKN